MTDKIQFVKNNMIDLIPIAKKIKDNEIEKYISEFRNDIIKLMWNDNQIATPEELNEIINEIANQEFEKGKASNQKDVLKILDELEKKIKEIQASLITMECNNYYVKGVNDFFMYLQQELQDIKKRLEQNEHNK